MTAAPIAAEEQARADVYGLLAQLFYAPPPRALLESLACMNAREADDSASGMTRAWRDLARRAQALDPEGTREEYESLFVGTGRAEVTLYVGAYLPNAGPENPLAALRNFLDAHGLARKASVYEPEDHFAALCETMRHLILRDDFAAQRNLFDRFLWPTVNALCDAISIHRDARFYAVAAQFAKSFLEIEHAAFEMD